MELHYILIIVTLIVGPFYINHKFFYQEISNGAEDTFEKNLWLYVPICTLLATIVCLCIKTEDLHNLAKETKKMRVIRVDDETKNQARALFQKYHYSAKSIRNSIWLGFMYIVFGGRPNVPFLAK